MNKITIDLSISKDAKAFEINQLLHQQEFFNAERLINSFTINNKDIYSHNTITVLGTRGSGKTTFLLSLLERFKNNEDSIFAVPGIIDPTLIEEKGHIFLTVVSRIKMLVEKKLDDIQDINIDRQKWYTSIAKLAEGLPSIDGVGGSLLENNWQDPEYILDKGIESVSAALNLKNDFKDFIDASLTILKKSYIIIAFDDIDIDFKKGWPVLETIRKYFTSSNIISILSGDLRFYSLAIRKQHWTNFGKALLINEGRNEVTQEYFNNLITEMESQYMLKVLKPDRRIHLTTLGEKLVFFKNNNNSNEIIIKKTKEQNGKELLSVYKNLLRGFGIYNIYQAESYYTYLLSLPIRTQIQFLSQAYDLNIDLEYGTITDAFLSDLIEKRVNTVVIENSPKLLNGEILKLLIKERVLGDAYQLQPNTEDSSLNGCLIALSFLSSRNFSKSPYQIFDYLIKIGYVRNLSSSLNYSSEKIGLTTNYKPSIEGLVWHASLYQDRVLRDTVGHINSYLRGAFPNNKIWGGMIPLRSLEEISKRGKNKENVKIDTVFEKESITKRIIGFMPISISAYSSKNGSETTYSIFTLLAGIGECIRKVELNDLKRGLTELSQIRTYTIPDFERLIFEGSEYNHLFNTSTANYTNSDANFFNDLTAWSSQKLSGISAHLLGKIITRYFYALKTIEENEIVENLGQLMHTRIIALFNAILLEEAREVEEEYASFNLNNTNFSNLVFSKNINYAIKNNISKKLNFSRWIFSCPLLLPFINHDSEVIYEIEMFCDFTFNSTVIEHNIYSNLSEVKIKGNGKTNTQSVKIFSRISNNEILNYLINQNVNPDLFSLNVDRLTMMKNNESIRNILSKFMPMPTITSSKIRSIRNYIASNNIVW